jgi:hypothetical protein
MNINNQVVPVMNELLLTKLLKFRPGPYDLLSAL